MRFNPDRRPEQCGADLYDEEDVQRRLDAEREEIAVMLEAEARPNSLLFAQLVRARIGRTL